MHSSMSSHGGDLKTDTVTIIGATLDLQEKVVKQVRFISRSLLSHPPSLLYILSFHRDKGKQHTILTYLVQAMTPISDVFMLSIDSKLDYALLSEICKTGHSRVPVFEEVEVPVQMQNGGGVKGGSLETGERMVKVQKIVGILLVKQCVLLDPEGTSYILFLCIHLSQRGMRHSCYFS